MTFRLRNGQTIALKPDVRFTLNEIYLDQVYDVPGVDFAGCRSVLDLGANMGIFALYVESKSPVAIVHCFEPEASNYEVLERNLAANRARARPYHLALSTACGTEHLSLEGSSAEYALGRAEGRTQAVECVDWTRLHAVTGVERFDFVKMDIEGAELPILEATSDDELRRIGALSLEWHHSQEKLRALAERLRGLGFEVVAKMVQATRLLKARLPVERPR
jgi:FkbM family methyltransferase